MIIWDYGEINYSWYINIIVFTSNVEALSGILILIFFFNIML